MDYLLQVQITQSAKCFALRIIWTCKNCPTQNYGWRERSKCFFDSDTRFEFRRFRDIRVRDSESRLNKRIYTSSGAGREVARLIDHEMHQQYKADKSHTENDLAVDQIHVIDDHRVLSTHHDDIIRIWSLKDGTSLLHSQNENHTSTLKHDYDVIHCSIRTLFHGMYR